MLWVTCGGVSVARFVNVVVYDNCHKTCIIVLTNYKYSSGLLLIVKLAVRSLDLENSKRKYTQNKLISKPDLVLCYFVES